MKREAPFIFLLLLLAPILKSRAQASRVDSTLLESYTTKLDSVLLYQSKWYDNTFLFEKVSQGFCFLQQADKERAEKMLKLCLGRSFLEKSKTNAFLKENFRCFDNEQKRIISNYLNQYLRPGDSFFHELVSLFQLSSQRKYLKSHLFSTALYEELKKNLTKGQLEKRFILELRNRATLANLGSSEMEDSLLSVVNDLYGYIKETGNPNNNYGEIISNSIPLLNSKKSVIQTLYMLDLENSTRFDSQDDLAVIGPAFSYFISCIQPKLKDFEIESLAWIDFEENKEEIKRRILNDNTIWWDHIKIEE